MASEPEGKQNSADAEPGSTLETGTHSPLPSEIPAAQSQQPELPLGDSASSTPAQVSSPVSEVPSESSATQAATDAVHEADHGTGDADHAHSTDVPAHSNDPYHDEYHHAHGDHYHDESHHSTASGESQYHHGGESSSTETSGSVGGGDSGTSDSSDIFGGPIKPFLEHLEDLRWVLIKTVSAVVIGMVIALVASNYIIQILTWPLKLAEDFHEVGGTASDIVKRVFKSSNTTDDWRQMTNRTVPVMFGTNEVFTIKAQDAWLSFGVTNKVDALVFTPITVTDGNGSTNRFLALKPVETAEHVSRNLVILKNYGPLNAFMVALKIALYGGLVLSMPFVIFFLAQFILPALRVREKDFLYRVAGYGTALFILGVLFCYFVVMTLTILVSVGFSDWLGFRADEWRAEEYISFICKFMIGMGLAFELPLVLLTLVKIGILNYRRLSEWRMYAVIANLIIAAIATPSPDPFTMCVVAVPMQILYELSVFIAWRWHRAAEKLKAQQPAAD